MSEPYVKKDFVLVVELTGKPSPKDIFKAIEALRREAWKEFGEGFTEKADVIGHNLGSGPDVYPVLVFRAFPPKP